MNQQKIRYGQLILLGTNGKGNRYKTRSKLTLLQHAKPNGVRPGPVSIVQDSTQSPVVTSALRHSVSYTLCRANTVVVEYVPNLDTDMVQIGRYKGPVIDFVVPANPENEEKPVQKQIRFRFRSKCGGNANAQPRSTVSRFACRIDIDRRPPHTARIYAAGFDPQRNIFLGEQAIKWRYRDMMDGFTTNGIRILRPSQLVSDLNRNGNTEPDQSSKWREVSVCGNIYKLYSSVFVPGEADRLSEDNVLEDFTLIDLSGSILLWRTAAGLDKGLKLSELMFMVDILNQMHIQCPVLYKTLRFKDNLPTAQPTATDLTSSTFGTRQPFVYLNCGHVHGWHNWRHTNDDVNGPSDDRTCPLCRQASRFVSLSFGEEVAFFLDRRPLTHCFNPCGHIASEATVQFWCSLNLPTFSTPEMSPRCPFCGVMVSSKPVRLIFNHRVDEDTLEAAFAIIWQDKDVEEEGGETVPDPPTPSAPPLPCTNECEEEEDVTELIPQSLNQTASWSLSVDPNASS